MSLLLMRASPFRQILSIPGTVALYLPYMDVVGKAYSSLTVSFMSSYLEHILVRNNGETSGYIRSSGFRWPVGAKMSARALVRKKEYSYVIVGFGNTSSDLKITVNLDTGEYTTSENSAYFDTIEASVTYVPNENAWDILIVAQIKSRFVQYAWVIGSPDGSYDYEGDGSSGVYLLDGHCGYGDAPLGAVRVGIPQSVVDRSGLGNTVQNGATSGTDASDFAWSHVSGYFDGVDDVIANEPVAEYTLYAWGATNSALGWVSEIPATAGYWFGGIRMSRTPGASEEARLKACIATILAGQGVSLA
jgi:hypothetical protein